MRTPIYKSYKNLKWIRRKLIWEPWKGKVIESLSNLGVAVGVVGPKNTKTPEVNSVECTKMIMDDFLTMYFDEKENILAYDPEFKAKEGDIVLIKKMEIPYAKDIHFKLKEILYQFGNVTDPISKRKVEGINYADNKRGDEKIHEIIRNMQTPEFESKGYNLKDMNLSK